MKRTLLAIIALLLLAAPAAAQEVCADSTSIVATGGAPHIVLYPDGSTYSSHSTESAAHRAAVNLSARLGVQVLVTRVAAWRVCSPAPGRDTTIVLPPPADTITPPPADTVVTPPPPPPPPADTVVPGPVDPDLMTFANIPSGFSVRTDARWGEGGGTATPPGWGMVARRGSIGVVRDSSSPTGGAVRMTYPAGMADAQEAGVAFVSSAGWERAEEVFIGVVMKYSAGFQPHGNQIKLHLINIGQYGWLGMFDGCRGKPAGHWTMAMWGAQSVAWPREGDCMENTGPLPRYTPGEWVKQEIYLNRTAGIIRVWIDGVLTLNATGLRFPSNLQWGEFQTATTWGGGGSSVPQTQSISVARHFIATR